MNETEKGGIHMKKNIFFGAVGIAIVVICLLRKNRTTV